MQRILVLTLLLAACIGVRAQTITGTITGSVKDASGLPVAGADVTLVQSATGASRAAKTDERGDFVFSSLQPDVYEVRVACRGFKTLVKSGINLSASETLPVGGLTLEVGAVADSVTVVAESATVQTASGEHAGLISSSDIGEALNMGRNITDLIQLLPGVVNGLEGTHQSIDANFTLNVQGNRADANNFTLNGINTNALGSNTSTMVNISQDSVAEVKVLLANYSAEYGRMSGPNIQLVTKSGTKSLHGGGSYFWRHEQFNADSFFNNRLGLPKPLYRYHTWAGNIGGPVTIPGKFNRSREKLFFFFSEEYWPLRYASNVGQVTVPTELERKGDFSQSYNTGNKLNIVKDPSTQTAFAGNVVPTSRIDPNGQALLNVFPLPNFLNTNISKGQYNYVWQALDSTPQRTESLKLDYNINSSNLLSFNFADYAQVNDGYFNGSAATVGTNWPQLLNRMDTPGYVFTLRYQHIFSPTTVNEFNAGYSFRPQDQSATDAELQANLRSTARYKAGQLFPEANPLQLIPNATFGGVPSAATLAIYGRYPLHSRLSTSSLTDNLTKTLGAHTLKAGIYFDRYWAINTMSVNFNGTFNFGTSTTNPLDTGYAYGNGLLGVYQTYLETSAQPAPQLTASNVEWFLQDNWKVTRRLTLDYGIRFCWIQPIDQAQGQVPGFDPAYFNPQRQPRLIAPIMISGKRAGVNPVTGEVYPAALIGAIAPGTGDIANGMILPANQPGYPGSLINSRGINYAPRVGFAFDPFGRGTTAIRGGVGMFYNRTSTNSTLYNLQDQPPVAYTQNLYYGTIPGLLSSTGYVFPNAVNGLDRAGQIPTVTNYSLIVEHRIATGTLVSVGYVGSLGRHLMWLRDLNSIPLGADFNPKNADPTNPSVPLTGAFLRPMQGLTSVLYGEWASSSNYHSLQATVNRRVASSLQIGAAWTWSKAMDYNDTDTDTVTGLVSPRVWNYGLASFDRTHNFKGNWVWDLPRTPFRNKLAKSVLNGWEMSGLASFVSGTPLGITMTTTNGADITGSASLAPRPVMTGNPVLPKGDRTFSQNFRADVFALPAQGTFGNEGRTVIRGPGINNWNLGLFKNVTVRERYRLQLRTEAYNAFNHTQFSSLNTSAQFNAQGVQTNGLLGAFTAARPARVMQFAIRLRF